MLVSLPGDWVMYTSPVFVSQETRVPNCIQVGFGVVVEPEPMVDAGAVVAGDPVVEAEVATRRNATALFLPLVLVHGVL